MLKKLDYGRQIFAVLTACLILCTTACSEYVGVIRLESGARLKLFVYFNDDIGPDRLVGDLYDAKGKKVYSNIHLTYVEYPYDFLQVKCYEVDDGNILGVYDVNEPLKVFLLVDLKKRWVSNDYRGKPDYAFASVESKRAKKETFEELVEKTGLGLELVEDYHVLGRLPPRKNLRSDFRWQGLGQR